MPPRDSRPHKSLTDPSEAAWLADISDEQALGLWLLDYMAAKHDSKVAKLAAETLRPNTAARLGKRADLVAQVATTEQQHQRSLEQMAAAPRPVVVQPAPGQRVLPPGANHGPGL